MIKVKNITPLFIFHDDSFLFNFSKSLGILLDNNDNEIHESIIDGR